MDTLNNVPGKDLLGEHLIVTPNSKRGGWFEVDVLHFNIDLPPKGVFVGIEVLSQEYYLSNNISIRGGSSVITFGATNSSANSKHPYVNCHYFKEPINSWSCGSYPMADLLINIVVELK